MKFIDVKKYGYEDIIFSYQVSKKYEVKFIPNALIHCGAIRTEEYIKRLEDSTEVLLDLYKNDLYKEDVIGCSKLLRAYLKIKNSRLLLLFGFNIIKPFIVKQLKSKNTAQNHKKCGTFYKKTFILIHLLYVFSSFRRTHTQAVCHSLADK